MVIESLKALKRSVPALQAAGDWILRRRFLAARRRIAGRLRGDGIEVGALDTPLPVSRQARVRYADRLTVDELRAEYPELRGRALVPTHIVANAEDLAPIADASVDFVVANHVLEHLEDPLKALQNFIRVLKPGGTLYLAIPDMRETFDRSRPTTTLAHLVRDYEEGPAWSKRAHYEEWAVHVDKAHAVDVVPHAAELMARSYSIHFHVWTPTELLELLLYCRRHLSAPFDFELMVRNQSEVIALLRRT